MERQGRFWRLVLLALGVAGGFVAFGLWWLLWTLALLA